MTTRLLTLVVERLGHHVSANAEVQPLQDWLQLHKHALENPVVRRQRGQEHHQHWTTWRILTQTSFFSFSLAKMDPTSNFGSSTATSDLLGYHLAILSFFFSGFKGTGLTSRVGEHQPRNVSSNHGQRGEEAAGQDAKLEHTSTHVTILKNILIVISHPPLNIAI